MRVKHALGFLKQLSDNINKGDDGGLAAEMAYHLMLSLLPAMVFLISVFDLLGNQFNFLDEVLRGLVQVAPKSLMPLIQDTFKQITAANSGGFALVGFLGMLWTASNGASVIVKGVSRAYDIHLENQSFIKDRMIAVLVILVIATGLLVALNLLLFGDGWIAFLADQLHLSSWIEGVLNAFRLVTVVVGLIGFSAFIYAVALFPVKPKISWKETLPGAVAFVGLWLSMSLGFSYYVDNMGNFNQVYGALGAVVILLTWLYLSSFALLVGGEVNALIRQNRNDRKKALNAPGDNPQTGSSSQATPALS